MGKLLEMISGFVTAPPPIQTAVTYGSGASGQCERQSRAA